MPGGDLCIFYSIHNVYSIKTYPNKKLQTTVISVVLRENAAIA